MINEFSRLQLLLDDFSFHKVKKRKVAIFGVGGVGGYVLEALARAGVMHFALIDNDDFSLTNLNRQILATHQSVGKNKVEVAKERILSINPHAEVKTYCQFYLPSEESPISFEEYDYIVDAIDTVTAKIDLILKTKQAGKKIISSMGCGNRFDPSKLRLGDIYQTEMDPLAKVMRRELKKRGIKSCPVLYSLEKPTKPKKETEEITKKTNIPGSSPFVPSVGGIMIAYWIFQDITGIKEPTC